MPDSNSLPGLAAPSSVSWPAVAGEEPRHSAVVRITHWATALCFLALLVSGLEIVISHPRFYWGEEGNVNTAALFSIPIPASRASVPTGYGYVLPDQNGWSRSLHFQSAWLLAFVAVVYVVSGLFSRHFQKELLPSRADLSPRQFPNLLLKPFLKRTSDARSYNPLQRITYLFVIFAAFPFMIWTGLAMSPGLTAAMPFLVNVLGGHQSARTLHFFGTLVLVLFVLGHVIMVCQAGFRQRTRAMITGR